MAKINKTSVYNYDDNVGKNDFLIGSDNDNGNITKNFKIEKILDISTTSKFTSAEFIPAYTPVAIINNYAYKLDSLNTNHVLAFYGFSKNESFIGEICIVSIMGEIEKIGWGLIPNTKYLAGPNGTMLIINNVIGSFNKVIGYAISENKLKIINEYTSFTNIIADNKIQGESPVGLVNNSNATFTSLNNFDSDTLEVYISSAKLWVGNDFQITGPNSFELFFSPLTGEEVFINYTKI